MIFIFICDVHYKTEWHLFPEAFLEYFAESFVEKIDFRKQIYLHLMKNTFEYDYHLFDTSVHEGV